MSSRLSRSAGLALALCLIASTALAQSTVLVVHSEPGDRVGGGIDTVITPEVTAFTLEKNYRGGVSVLIGAIGQMGTWRMEFSPPEGDPLAVAYYPGALPHPWAAMAAMLIDGPGGGCLGGNGRFLVRELLFGSENEVLKLALDAEHHCFDDTPALFIALRYNSSVPTDMFPGSIGRFGINITPSPDGIVTGDGIACGNGQTVCAVVFETQTTVTLTAVPRSGHIFTGWAGACSGGATTVVNVNMVRDCRATFASVVPSTARTLLTLRFSPGDPLRLSGGEEVYSLENSRWTLDFWNDGLIFDVSGSAPEGVADRSVRIMPPPGMVLGQWYEVANGITSGAASLGVSVNSMACGTTFGRIRIHEWRVSPLTGQFAFAADFEQRCGSPTAALLTGSIRYGATFEIPPPPPPPPACSLPDPFAALGGGTCHNGGWLPPGMMPPPPPPAPATVLVFQSEPGDYIGQGLSESYTPATVETFTVARNFRGGVSADIRAGDLSFWWSLDFADREGTPLAVGYYPGALGYPFAATAAIDISGTGRACGDATGRFLVRELVYGPTGEVLKAAIDGEQHCGDRNAAVFVALRYNSAVPTDMFPGSIGRYGINITPSAHGMVVGDGISCGSMQSDCSVVFSSFTNATLTAIPNPGYIFTGWTGACTGDDTIAIKINMLRDCTAHFDTATPTAPRTLLVTSNPTAGSFGQSPNVVFSALNSVWRPQLQGAAVVLDITGAGPTKRSDFMLRVTPPAGVLYYGYWYDTTPFGAEGTAGLTVSTGTLGCDPARERVRIHEWRLNSTATALEALALDFERYCGTETTPLLTGTLRYQATFDVQPPASTPPPAPPPPTSSTCTTPDPFAALGGGICHNGGWLPPGMSPPGGGTTTPPPSTPPPSPPPPTSSTCGIPDPFSAMGGGTCYNGGWLPPGMPVPGGSTPPPAPEPPPPTTPSTGCTTPDPFTALGGGTCYRGGWLPPGMPNPGGGG